MIVSMFSWDIIDAYLRFHGHNMNLRERLIFDIIGGIGLAAFIRKLGRIEIIFILTLARHSSLHICLWKDLRSREGFFLLRFYLWVDCVSHDDFRVLWSIRLGHLAGFNRVLVVIEHFFDTPIFWGKLSEFDLGAIDWRVPIAAVIAALSPRTIIFELAHTMQHRQIISDVSQNVGDRLELPSIILLILLFANDSQFRLQRRQSFLLLRNPSLRLRWIDQLIKWKVAESRVKGVNNAKKLFTFHRSLFYLLRCSGYSTRILQSNERLSMWSLPADHPSRAFTLFYCVFGFVIGGWHFASRYFHDLNLLSYQKLIIIIFTRMEKAKKKSKKAVKKIATPTFNADINLD